MTKGRTGLRLGEVRHVLGLRCAWFGAIRTAADPALAAGGSAEVAVTVKASKAGTVLLLAVAAAQVPDPHPLNNLSIQAITIKH